MQNKHVKPGAGTFPVSFNLNQGRSSTVKNKLYCNVNQQKAFNNQKNNPSVTTKAHKQLGNTLVPVLISMVIMSAATAAFLIEGADLNSRSKVSVAGNEIAGMIYDWNLVRTSNAASVIGGSGAGNPPAPASMTNSNTYGNTITFTAGATPNVVYTTDSATSCTSLSGTFNATILGVASSSCAEAVLTINLN